MKLRNKKTGEIWNIGKILLNDYPSYDTLEQINEDFEDYEGTKAYWFIDYDGGIVAFNRNEETATDILMKQIGNYFSSRDEAEKAVEKLKAWKRLKDKGAEFYGWRRNQTGTYELYLRWEDRIPRSYKVKNDLDLLFGGEE